MLLNLLKDVKNSVRIWKNWFKICYFCIKFYAMMEEFKGQRGASLTWPDLAKYVRSRVSLGEAWSIVSWLEMFVVGLEILSFV